MQCLTYVSLVGSTWLSVHNGDAYESPRCACTCDMVRTGGAVSVYRGELVYVMIKGVVFREIPGSPGFASQPCHFLGW